MTGTGQSAHPFLPQRDVPRRRLVYTDLSLTSSPTTSEIRIVIVRDMWPTGFDAPCLSTMYLGKPIRGHGLMQTFARVNRVFWDKPGGLVVDYLGLTDELKRALGYPLPATILPPPARALARLTKVPI